MNINLEYLPANKKEEEIENIKPAAAVWYE